MTGTVTLSDELFDWLKRNASQHGYADVAAYVAALIEAEREERAYDAWLVRMVEEGEASGMCEQSAEEIFDEVRRLAVQSA